MQVSWHHITVHNVLHVNSEWCDQKNHLNHEELSVCHDQRDTTVNKVLSADSTDRCLSL